MFTIRRGANEYYTRDRGFVTLEHYKEIYWFEYYLPCSQQMMKLGSGEFKIADARMVLIDLLEGLTSIAPELLQLTSFFHKAIDVPKALLEVAALRGGLIEHKAELDALRKRNQELETRDAFLVGEAKRLEIVMTDYQRLVQRGAAS